MSTTSLPAYTGRLSFQGTPAYSAEPHAYEQRLALNRPVLRPEGSFVKQSKNVSLRLYAQDNNASLPIYGCGAAVEGAVTLSGVEGVTAVEVKIEGNLHLREVGEGGTTTYKLCLEKVTLWSKEMDSESCPSMLEFSLTLPTTFSDDKDTYPLPPTHDVHLSGVPGFTAATEYKVSVSVTKSKASQLLRIGNGHVSTPFIYYPRSRPGVPLPAPMRQSFDNFKFIETPEWQRWESVMKARLAGGMDILCQLYIPASRVYSITQPIPFHVMFSSSAFSLAAFLPYGPTATILAPNKQFTRLRVVRKSTVDVRNEFILGTKTDIWRVDPIGEGDFKHSGDGHEWLCFNGEIRLDKDVKVGSFKAGGLSVRDFLEFTMQPPEPSKAPFKEMRLVIPIHLTTDAWSVDSMAQAVVNNWTPPSPPDSTHEGQAI
ncbi:hypothetical protein BD309DRAFT_1026670 [Dichomitus squalens]|uniref:Arrestin-like N-terminal domain-containing protein n=1 Tax=Dichomitus squalens TaxID=114155 RepID=A0A4Q9Q4G4_9APHY|nr:hypothetical protein BD311DRAFT_402310 [Dichomitus squalens]TBU44441.1 hypothetical protein BD309DRAFT_1026670 [Dichomitus squalens]TBU62217.1 hypothetical protein BD310DRAFT_811220 [Dichomitus squalens]